MLSPVLLIYLLLALLASFNDTLPTSSPTAPSSPLQPTKKFWPTLSPLPPPTTLWELTSSGSILLSLLHKGLPHVHARVIQNSIDTTTHILCDPMPTSDDLIDAFAGTNWLLHQGEDQFHQTNEHKEVVRWGTAGFSVYSTPVTYAYPYSMLGYLAGVISRKCRLDSGTPGRGGGNSGEGGEEVKVRGSFAHVEGYADLMIFRKAFYREDWL